MRKIIVLAVLFAISAHCINAQLTAPAKEDVEAFNKSKTYVVLEDNPFSVFNAYATEGLEKIWKITPFEVISYEEFEKKMSDTRSSFLYVAQASFGKSQSYDYTIINLVMGDASKNLNKLHDLCIVPVAYAEVDEESYEYRFGALLKFVDYYMKYISKNPGKDIEQMVKENATEMNKYELWLTKSELAVNVNTVEKIKKYYPYAVKIVEPEEIDKAIEENYSNVALLHKVGPEGTVLGATCYKFIITAKEGKPLYFSEHKITSEKPDAFLEEDFKKLSK
ncbi:MAG: hypothetical protein M0R16_02910 [Bacteroidales bacterium]|jgi:hypothetical protein|nr:hypothetical protein [Bacteroidales bacterium]